MTTTFERPVSTTPPPAPVRASAGTRGTSLPFWLRTPPKRNATRSPALTPSEPRWWVGVVWLIMSAMLVGFVANVTLVGSLQHARAQYTMYQQLRGDLALATAPLGQLDVDGKLVPEGTPIGIISVQNARVQIDEVFVQGTSGATLNSGPGHRRDSVMPGQNGTSILMGRQAAYGGPFGYLSALEPGDVIEITTGQGVAKYEVIGLRREGDLLPQAPADGEGRLELITGDGNPLIPSGALYVDAELVGEPWDTPSPVFTEAVLRPAELAMAPDSDAWLGVAFWSVLLICAGLLVRWVRGKWGAWQTWTISIPVLLPLGCAVSNALMTLFPNLI